MEDSANKELIKVIYRFTNKFVRDVQLSYPSDKTNLYELFDKLHRVLFIAIVSNYDYTNLISIKNEKSITKI